MDRQLAFNDSCILHSKKDPDKNGGKKMMLGKMENPVKVYTSFRSKLSIKFQKYISTP
jgi:hypothetical protein